MPHAGTAGGRGGNRTRVTRFAGEPLTSGPRPCAGASRRTTPNLSSPIDSTQPPPPPYYSSPPPPRPPSRGRAKGSRRAVPTLYATTTSRARRKNIYDPATRPATAATYGYASRTGRMAALGPSDPRMSRLPRPERDGRHPRPPTSGPTAAARSGRSPSTPWAWCPARPCCPAALPAAGGRRDLRRPPDVRRPAPPPRAVQRVSTGHARGLSAGVGRRARRWPGRRT